MQYMILGGHKHSDHSRKLYKFLTDNMKLKEEVLIIVTTLKNKESDTKSWIYQIKINRRPQLLLGCESA